MTGKYLPHPIVKAAWLEITGDSSIVDIRPVRDGPMAASYVAKYAGKSVDARVWSDPERLTEAMLALVSRRTFQTFGSWTDLNLSIPDADDTVWVPLAPLSTIIIASHAGDLDAQRIVRALSRSWAKEPIDLDQRGPPLQP